MTDGTPASSPAGRRRGLTRRQIVKRALEIGDREGLDAVSVRRVASELHVTSMALYRHVKDKNDLFSAMLEAVTEGADLKAGVLPAMPWQDQVRRFLHNAADILTAHPVILPLQIAYQGPLTATVVGPLEGLLSILLEAGFSAEDAVSLARATMLLLAGLLLLSGPGPVISMPEPQLELAHRRAELTLLELPEDRYPVIRGHARLFAEAFISPGEGWVDQTIDLLVAGLESKLRNSRGGEDR